MPDSAGLNRETGAPLTDMDHVKQSIGVILTTPVGDRVMRREFGSEVPALIDRPMTDAVILAVYAATANALARWEPRFDLVKAELVQASADGTLQLIIAGRYLPKGHTGDDTPARDVSDFTVPLGRAA